MSKMNLNVGIAGLGTVGVGVVKILQSRSELLEQRTGKKINIVAVSARSQKDRGINLDGIKWYDNASDIADDENVDTVVELIGGDEGIAYDLCLKAIKNGKNLLVAINAKKKHKSKVMITVIINIFNQL